MRIVNVERLKPGFIIGRPLTDENGMVLLNSGVQLTQAYIDALIAKGYSRLYVKDPESLVDVEPEEDITPLLRTRALKAVQECYSSIEKEFADLRGRSMADVKNAIQSDSVKTLMSSSGALGKVSSLVTNIMEEVLNHSTLTGLTSIKSANSKLYEHSIDVCVISIMIGQNVGLNTVKLKQLAMGALLHDIGMVFVEPGVAETRRLRQHTLLGFELLKATDNPDILAPHVALEHHEHQDGSGQPRGTVGGNKIERDRNLPAPIPTLIGEIVAVANTYDRLLSGAESAAPVLPDEAVASIRDMAGPILNRAVVSVFLRLVPAYPLGIEVIVRGGKYRNYSGVVTQVNRNALDRPWIALTHDEHGRALPETVEMDLSAQEQIDIRCKNI